MYAHVCIQTSKIHDMKCIHLLDIPCGCIKYITSAEAVYTKNKTYTYCNANINHMNMFSCVTYVCHMYIQYRALNCFACSLVNLQCLPTYFYYHLSQKCLSTFRSYNRYTNTHTHMVFVCVRACACVGV